MNRLDVRSQDVLIEYVQQLKGLDGGHGRDIFTVKCYKSYLLSKKVLLMRVLQCILDSKSKNKIKNKTTERKLLMKFFSFE